MRYMPLFFYGRKVLVVCAQSKSRHIQPIIFHALQQRIGIACRTAFAYVYIHTFGIAFQQTSGIVTFMVIGNAF